MAKKRRKISKPTGRISFKKWLLIFLIGAIIAGWGYRLRVHEFASYPPIDDTSDEVKCAFNGISLLKKGVPESWSWYKEYDSFTERVIRGVNYRFVKPYFDDPPLCGVFYGAYSLWKGMDSFEKIEVGALRWPTIKLGAVNVFLFFLLIYLIADLKTAVLAGLIYAVQPIVVLSSRLPMAENLIVMAMLTSLILVKMYLDRPRLSYLFLIALISGGSILFKPIGYFLPASIGIIFFAARKKKETIIVVLATAFFTFIWFAYGYYYDWPLFLNLFGNYSGRGLAHPVMVARLLDVFRITETPSQPDFWVSWGWVTAFIFGSFGRNWRGRKDRWLYFIAPLGTYLVLFSIMSGHHKGWYRIPFYPLLAWSSAEVFLYLYRHPTFIGSLFFACFPLAEAFVVGKGRRHFDPGEIRVFQKLFPLLFSIPLLGDLTRGKNWLKLTRILLATGFILMIFWSSRAILHYSDEFWYRQ